MLTPKQLQYAREELSQVAWVNIDDPAEFFDTEATDAEVTREITRQYGSLDNFISCCE